MLNQVETLNLLNDLEPVVEKELNRHISIAKEWFPHDYIPWDEARNFAHLGGQDWTPQEQRFSEAARTSLIINLLTEDNLPSYHHEIATIFGREGAWGEWVGRWTAEEGRHGTAIRDYLVVTRAVDPVALEQARMFHMQEGFQAIHPGMLAGLSSRCTAAQRVLGVALLRVLRRDTKSSMLETLVLLAAPMAAS